MCINLTCGRALDARYPGTVDTAVNSALQPLRTSDADAPERGQAQRVAGFVAAALERGLRAPLGGVAGRGGGTQAGFTVQRAIDAPAAELRVLVCGCAHVEIDKTLCQ